MTRRLFETISRFAGATAWDALASASAVKASMITAMLLGVVLVAGAGLARADTIISAQFESTAGLTAVNYSGVEADAAKADSAFSASNVWNHLQASFTHVGSISFSNLVSSTGAATGSSLAISNVNGAFNSGSGLPGTYLYALQTTQTFTFSGLAPNQSFSLFLYAVNAPNTRNARGAIFSAGSSTFDTANGNPSSEDSFSAVTGMLTGTTSATGSITGTWAFDSQNTYGEIDWSGFQLDVKTPAAVTPEPASLLLLGTGLLGLGILVRRRQRHGVVEL